MTHPPMLNNIVFNRIANNLNSVLDVGCGYGEWGFFLKTRKNCKWVIGIDIWKPYLKNLKPYKVYDDLIQAKAAFLPFRPKSFQLILCIEVIEHMKKQEGFQMLKELEEIGNKIIVTTILNYPQDTINGNIYQRHVSEWRTSDFQKLGYNARYLHSLGPRTLRFIDKIRRKIFRMHPTPILLIAERGVG